MALPKPNAVPGIPIFSTGTLGVMHARRNQSDADELALAQAQSIKPSASKKLSAPTAYLVERGGSIACHDGCYNFRLGQRIEASDVEMLRELRNAGVPLLAITEPALEAEAVDSFGAIREALDVAGRLERDRPLETSSLTLTPEDDDTFAPIGESA